MDYCGMFTQIPQISFTGMREIVWVPQWSQPERYGYIDRYLK